MNHQHDLFSLYKQLPQTDQHLLAPWNFQDMWQSYSNGLLVAFGLIMAIGAQNAFVLAQSLRREPGHSVRIGAIPALALSVWSAGPLPADIAS